MDVTAMSYNTMTPDRDYQNWEHGNPPRKTLVVDEMLKNGAMDVYGIQESKYGADQTKVQICEEIKAELNNRGNNYAYVSGSSVPELGDSDTSIFYDANKWNLTESGGKKIAQDQWDPRGALYVVLTSKADPTKKMIVFNTHAPTGAKHPGDGYTDAEYAAFGQFELSIRQKFGMNLPVINTGDWNTSGGLRHHTMTNFENQGLKDSIAGATFPSNAPTDWDDHILTANVFELAASIDKKPNVHASDHPTVFIKFKI